jgi:hypothetical protein
LNTRLLICPHHLGIGIWTTPDRMAAVRDETPAGQPEPSCTSTSRATGGVIGQSLHQSILSERSHAIVSGRQCHPALDQIEW